MNAELTLTACILMATTSGVATAAEDNLEPANHAKVEVGEWGVAVDPEGDCKFDTSPEQLVITVPGGLPAHDLSAETGNMKGPRAVTEVEGDFSFEVKVDGTFSPGGDSSQPGRSGYTGAGILVMADESNYIRIERATLHWSGQQPHPYLNFEIRVDGQCQRYGTTGDAKIENDKPTFLRIERKGSTVSGAVSHDGNTWQQLEPKQLPASWPSKVKVGVAAVSTSMTEFTPAFSERVLRKGQD